MCPGPAGDDNIHTVAEWLTELYLVSKRLLTNKLYMFNLIGTTAALFGFLGFATFLPKYFEYVFQRVSFAFASKAKQVVSMWLNKILECINGWVCWWFICNPWVGSRCAHQWSNFGQVEAQS